MDNLKRAFEVEYGAKPQVIAQAPGRIHLMGEHSWFFRDKTLSMAVSIPVFVAASVREDSAIHFSYVQLKDHKHTTITALKFKKEDKWANALKSVIYGFTSAGFEMKGLNLMVSSEILPSAGFGITSAEKMATAMAVRQIFKFKCSDAELIQVIERGNRRFLGIENYTADNNTTLYSKAGTILLTDHNKSLYENIPLDLTGKTVLLVDTKVPRVSLWNEEVMTEPENVLLLGELKERKANAYGGWVYDEDTTNVNEVLNVVSEDMRRKLLCIMREHKAVLASRDAIVNNDFGKFARYINFSHEGMRDLYEISCPEIDWILKRLLELCGNPDDTRHPFAGGRITGKGFGRCLYAILPVEKVEDFKKKLVEFERIFGFHPFCYEVEPADGAKIIEEA